MKKALVLVLLLVAALAGAQVVYETDSWTLAWDAVTTYQDGAPLPADATVAYDLGYSVSPVADREAPDTIIGLTAGTSTPITTPDSGQYAYAARTRVISASKGTEWSAWLWGDVDGSPQPWLVTKVPPPNPPQQPGNIRIQ